MSDNLGSYIVELQLELIAANADIERLATQKEVLIRAVKDYKELIEALETYCEENHDSDR
jgi:hypothetical protein